MHSTKDRATSVLDRPSGAVLDEPDVAPATALPDLPPPAPATDRDDAVAAPATGSAAAGPVVPHGWGSREERRLALWGLAGFFLLGLYATLFVLVGAVVWS